MKQKIAVCKNKKGQSLVEFLLVSVMVIAVIFGIMDVSRLSWTMFHLNGAAFAAARAESVGRDPKFAANYVTMTTLNNPCLVTIERDKIKTSEPFFNISSLSKKKMAIYSVNVTVLYFYKPLFRMGIWKNGIPIRVTSRMQTEAPSSIPRSK